MDAIALFLTGNIIGVGVGVKAILIITLGVFFIPKRKLKFYTLKRQKSSVVFTFYFSLIGVNATKKITG